MQVKDKLYINGRWVVSGSTRRLPLDGSKQSGHDRELGRYGLEEFLELKSQQQ
jgi:acyl-CoA reductase-like NAD-dependent aldehyde dehydrogenase